MRYQLTEPLRESGAATDAVFIDKITAFLPYHHSWPVGGRVRREATIEDGVVYRQTMLSERIKGPGHSFLARSVPVDSSDPSKGYAGIEIDACPPKVFQGHNAWGNGDVAAYIHGLWKLTIKQLKLEIPEEITERWIEGDIKIRRVDCTAMISVQDCGSVKQVLDALSTGARSSHRPGYPTVYQNSVCFGANSSRWQLKIYNKLHEMVVKGADQDLPEIQEALIWVADKLRVEVVVKSQELERLGLDWLREWDENTARTLWDRYRGRLRISSSPIPTIEIPDLLNSAERRTFALWQAGADLQKLYCRQTFSAHQKHILKTLGVDISMPPTAHNRIDLRDLLLKREPVTHSIDIGIVDKLTCCEVTTVQVDVDECADPVDDSDGFVAGQMNDGRGQHDDGKHHRLGPVERQRRLMGRRLAANPSLPPCRTARGRDSPPHQRLSSSFLLTLRPYG